MKNYALDKEEQEILDGYDRGEFVEVPNQKEIIAEMIAAARAQTKKTKNINLRLTEQVVFKLKAKALEEGIPYQTLAASILHKSVNGKL